MGLFDVFKKKDCEICGKEVGLLGYKKLKDGEICKDCVKLLSPWFEDRRESTVAEIKEQLVYRQRNAKEHENFTITRKIGDEEYYMYIEEVNGVPTRFFVTNRSDYKSENPDIISFKDVISCVTDIQVRDEEIKERNAEGQMVSCNPRRYKHHHDFVIKMEIRNNPYFDEIKFRINGSDITLETVGDVGGGFGGAALAGLFQGVGLSTTGVQTNSLRNSSENRRYESCRMICQKIEQAVEDGKRGAAAPAQTANEQDPVMALFARIPSAQKEELDLLLKAICDLTLLRPDYREIQEKAAKAISERQLELFAMRTNGQVNAAVAPQTPTGPKFCPNCGAPYEGGKFCQSCGSKL